jgi:hypothetical protein
MFLSVKLCVLCVSVLKACPPYSKKIFNTEALSNGVAQRLFLNYKYILKNTIDKIPVSITSLTTLLNL